MPKLQSTCSKHQTSIHIFKTPNFNLRFFSTPKSNLYISNIQNSNPQTSNFQHSKFKSANFKFPHTSNPKTFPHNLSFFSFKILRSFQSLHFPSISHFSLSKLPVHYKSRHFSKLIKMLFVRQFCRPITSFLLH
jgi:hypothetical protein